MRKGEFNAIDSLAFKYFRYFICCAAYFGAFGHGVSVFLGFTLKNVQRLRPDRIAMGSLIEGLLDSEVDN
jgi:hypothetical protein